MIWDEYWGIGYELITEEFPNGIYPYDGTWAAWLGGELYDQSHLANGY